MSGSIRDLELTVEARLLPLFFGFLQSGFLLELTVDGTVSEFLQNRCKLSTDEIAERVATVFIDGQPVDDIEQAIVRDRCTLALSGAMPGLVGAVMRSNSPLRSFRGSITHQGSESDSETGQGLIRVKLFNTVLRDVGPVLLRDGILLEPQKVGELLEERFKGLEDAVIEVVFEGTPTDVRAVLGSRQFINSELLVLSVRTGG